MNSSAGKDGLVKSCPKLESGLRLGQEGLHACQLGPFSSPIFWTAEELATTKITREMIAEKRKWIFDLLNDDHRDTPCKHCHMVVRKRPEEVRFDRLGHIDLAASTLCNLRCSFCGYAIHDSFSEARYDALEILRLFKPEDVVWNAAVDFNGGEPTLLKDFDAYIDYFNSRRIRVFLYTNAVIYRQSVYDGLAAGTIRWVIISLDAGTPSTYHKIKKSRRFADVVENITRYSQAGSKGGGRVAVKYIFCRDNCGEDDICGFTYAMLAIRPQEIWLTFDFEPLAGLPGDCADFGGYDYSRHVSAYAKTYTMFAKHGVTAVHFPEKHLATVSLQGKLLLKAAKEEIARIRSESCEIDPALHLEDFRAGDETMEATALGRFALEPTRVRRPGGAWRPLSLAGKRIALAPACAMTRRLLTCEGFREAKIIAFLDRDPVLHGKVIDGVRVEPYSKLPVSAPDLVVVAAADHNRDAVAQAAARHLDDPSRVLIYEPSACEEAA